MSIALPFSTQSVLLAQLAQLARPARTGLPGLPWLSAAMHMPFDLMRAQHAHAIQSGLLANSILESRDFERRVDAFERICLGPFARSV